MNGNRKGFSPWSLIFCLLAWLCLASQRADATQFLPLSIEQITKASQLIVQGTVTSKTTLRDDTGRIYTKVDLAIADLWKGTLTTNHLTIALAGGVLGEERVVAVGQADYNVGEEVIAFLVLNQRGEGVTLGLAHGKFEVHAEPGTGRRMAHSQFHGRPPAIQTAPKPGSRPPLTVDELKQRVLNAGK